MVLKARGIFQELLAFNTQWKSEEADSNISEWMPQEEDKRTCQREWRQANKKSFPSSCPFIWSATRRCHPHLRWVFLLQIIWSRKFLTGVPASCILVDSRFSQVNNQDYTPHVHPLSTWHSITFLRSCFIFTWKQ